MKRRPARAKAKGPPPIGAGEGRLQNEIDFGRLADLRALVAICSRCGALVQDESAEKAKHRQWHWEQEIV